MQRSISRRRRTCALIDRALKAALASAPCASSRTREAFHRLFLHVRARSCLLDSRGGAGRPPGHDAEVMIAALLALAERSAQWRRPVEDWRPRDAEEVFSRARQFRSLAGHLLAKYPLPGFFTSVWHRRDERLKDWYVHLGGGGSVRSLDLPLPYTRLMAHHFLLARDHFSVEQALRWGQVRGLGGSMPLADAVAGTRLGSSFDCEDFWLTVLHFFVNHPELDPALVRPIVDHLHEERFERVWRFDESLSEITLGPAQPRLAMKGRTPRSILRQMADQLGFRPHKASLGGGEWGAMTIAGFEYAERASGSHGARVWAIRELLSRRELRALGRVLRNCVGRYASLCRTGRSAIFALNLQDQLGTRPVLAIEVEPTRRRIVQAKGFLNKAPRPKLRRILELWAGDRGLTLGC